MTEKQADILAKILTGLIVILFILAFKYILAIGILLMFFVLYAIITVLF